MAGKDYAPQQISAMILRRLRALAQDHLGLEVNKAVITRPTNTATCLLERSSCAARGHSMAAAQAQAQAQALTLSIG
jgi:hypothetical protein